MVASISCIRSRESAGPMVDNGVTDQMVGDRRSPGATILGVEFEYLLRQPSLLGPPSGSEHRDALLCGRFTRWRSCTFRRVPVPFWDFGSWFKRQEIPYRRCGVPRANCCGSGSPLRSTLRTVPTAAIQTARSCKGLKA